MCVCVCVCVCVGGTQGSVQCSKVGTIELSSLFEDHQIPICLVPRSCPTMLFCEVCPLQSSKTLWMMNDYSVILFHRQSLPGRLVKEFDVNDSQ